MKLNAKEKIPFIGFREGDLVLVQPFTASDSELTNDWWMGWIINVDTATNSTSKKRLFQVADCDTGEVKWINPEEATRLVLSGLRHDNIIHLPQHKDQNVISIDY